MFRLRIIVSVLISSFVLCLLNSPDAYGARNHKKVEVGKATWISKRFHGKTTASGEKHNCKDLVAAHRTLPFGAFVRVTNLANNKFVVVRINERKPYSKVNIISVSWKAAQMLDMLDKGISKAKLEIVTRQVGIASWYGNPFHGRRTANGEIYDMNKITAAHKALPFNTKVLVTNLRNQKTVIVRINDRGPFIKGRVIDLSKEAARKLGMLDSGVEKVILDILPHK